MKVTLYLLSLITTLIIAFWVIDKISGDVVDIDILGITIAAMGIAYFVVATFIDVANDRCFTYYGCSDNANALFNGLITTILLLFVIALLTPAIIIGYGSLKNKIVKAVDKEVVRVTKTIKTNKGYVLLLSNGKNVIMSYSTKCDMNQIPYYLYNKKIEYIPLFDKKIVISKNITKTTICVDR